MATISARHFWVERTYVNDGGFTTVVLYDRHPNTITRTWCLALHPEHRTWAGLHYWEHVPEGEAHYRGLLPKKLTNALIAAAVRDGYITTIRTSK